MNLRILPSLSVLAYVLMLSVPTYAQTSDAEEAEEPWTDEEIQHRCAAIGEVAESVLRDRLAGVPMSQQMAERLEKPAIPPSLLRAIILGAYRDFVSLSEYTDAKNDDYARAFRDGAEMACYSKFYGEDGMGSK